MGSVNCKRRGAKIIIGLLSVGFFVTVLIGFSDSDLAWTSLFYMSEGSDTPWGKGKFWLFSILYKYGEIPGVALAVISFLFYLLCKFGYISPKYKKPLMVIILTVILGPGLVVNGLLKEYWGRPRPVDIKDFGSTEQYRHFWNPGGRGYGKSFVCGHCAIAFSTCSIIAFYPIHPVLASIGFGAGLVYGVTVSLARISQGGHFTTDTIWSAVIVMALITVLYYFVFRIPDESNFT